MLLSMGIFRGVKKYVLPVLALAVLAFLVIYSVSAFRGSTLDQSRATLASMPQGVLANVVIVLDPGHGGIDTGCSSKFSDVTESELNLQVAYKLKAALEARGASVMMTRTDETVVYMEGAGKTRKQRDMAYRMDCIEKARAQLVFSIHMNRYSSQSTRGAQVFYYEEGSHGQLLALCIQAKLNSLKEQVKQRTALRGDYFILKTPKCPCALIECGFLSNKEEEALLRQESYQVLITQAICDGIEEYLD
jgi:N-acetylmuramoyl-L-alanine amidase